MKTLVVMNEKGGVGKTNIVAHAGWYFAEKYRTLVIDLDQQANLTTTLAANLSTVQSVTLFSEPTRVPSGCRRECGGNGLAGSSPAG
jgi:chromosome partitioning protein